MDAIESTPSALAEATVVLVDTPCRKCQYNLRSLSVEGRCPECGTPVGLSIKGDLLRYSVPSWLRTLRRGVVCIIAGTVVGVGAFVVVGMLRYRGWPESLVWMASWVITYLGSWLLTMPDPGGLGEDQYGTSRKIIRFTLLFGVFSHLTSYAERFAAFLPNGYLVIQVINAAAMIASVVGQIAMLNYLRKIALRIPDERMARWAGFLTYTIGVTYSLFAVFIVMNNLIRRNPGGRRIISMLDMPAGFDFLALIIAWIIYLIVLVKFGRRFREAEVFSRQTWLSASAD
jgi:hypothetical protein